MHLDGTLCESCGVFLNENPPGYPCYCVECGGYDGFLEEDDEGDADDSEITFEDLLDQVDQFCDILINGTATNMEDVGKEQEAEDLRILVNKIIIWKEDKEREGG